MGISFPLQIGDAEHDPTREKYWGFVSLVLRTEEAMVIPFSLLQMDEHRLAMQRMTAMNISGKAQEKM